ncbi:hypothetical protein [Amycolatopsis sp. NPDC049159]|uniref:hypothetical protein n=1 Tax=Amycolatopsis sp. NPDC049159 TaxID=3157210 RepID=UPI0033F301C4
MRAADPLKRDPGPPDVTGSTGLTPEQRYRGARVVASAATDARDCASLLATLGLEAADGVAGARRGHEH